MSQKTILQVPIKTALRNRASKSVERQGFSSLQEAIRVFLHQLAENKIALSFTEPPQRLSPKSEKRYTAMLTELSEHTSNIKAFTNTDALMKHLSR